MQPAASGHQAQGRGSTWEEMYMFRKAAVWGVAAALVAAPFIAAPSQTEAAEVMGQLYMPEESGVSVGSGGGMGIGMDLDQTLGKKKAENHETARAEIWLIGAHINFKTMSQDTLDAWYREKKIPAGQPIFYQETDNEGKFDIKNVPGGDYYLVVVNNYVPGRGSDSRAVQELQQYLPDYDMFQLFVTGYSEPTATRFHLTEHEIGSFNTMPAPTTDKSHPAYDE